MLFPPSQTVRGEAQLRALTGETLRRAIVALETGRLRIRIPRPRGLMRFLPEKYFHLHPELFVQLSGETLFEFPQEAFRLRGGEVCVVPRGMPHGERVKAWRGPFANLVFLNQPREVLFHLAREAPKGRPEGVIGSRLENPRGSLAALLDEAAELSGQPGEAAASGLKGLMLAYFSLALTALAGPGARPEPEPFKVAQARHWVMKALPDPRLSVSFLARQLQCNADYLSRLFRETAGMTLQAYIQTHRMHRAQDLLATSLLNVAEVSAAAGFRDPSYFTRAFRRWAGVTPREFRHRARAQG